MYHNEKIEFLGKVSNIKTVDIIKKSRAVVSATSLYEVQPTLLCEASFNSIPSIFPDNGGISEYFPSDYFLKYNLETDKELFKNYYTYKIKKFKKASKEAKKFITTIINEENYLNKLEAVFNVYKNELISILISVYNNEKSVRKSIKVYKTNHIKI